MKLKVTLLSQILDNSFTHNRYSKAYLNLLNVFEIEENENFKFSDNIYKKFAKIKDKYENFYNKIPLIIIERYYFDHKEELNKYVFLEYKECELSEMRIIELYQLLEEFFIEIFNLASLIASYYNLEIKLNSNSNSKEENKFL